jgi:hypothetical protein
LPRIAANEESMNKTVLPPLGLGLTRVAPGVLARIGETFAVALSALHRSLESLSPAASGQQGPMAAALAEIDRLESLGVRLQEFARVLGAEVPLPAERLDLVRAARQALEGRAPSPGEVTLPTATAAEPIEVDVNAAVLDQLLSLALDCAQQLGSTIAIAVEREGQPARPLLSIRVDRAPGARDDGAVEDFGDLPWTLFALLARAAGLFPQRLAAGRSVTLMLGFPDAGGVVGQDADPRSQGLPRSGDPAGRHVLLLEPRETARVMAHRLMNDAGMHIDSAATLDQAREGLKYAVPDIIVTGLPIDDAGLAALLDQARLAQPRLRVIQLVDDENAFAFSVPGSDNPAQVGRHDMAHTLVAAVAQELDAAWAD